MSAYGWSILGWPLVWVYMISRNYEALWSHDNAKKTLVYGTILSILLILAILFLPSSLTQNFPKMSFPLFYSFLFMGFVQAYQEKNIKEYIKNWWQEYKFWHCLGISLIGLIIITIPIFGLSYALSPTMSTQYYGSWNWKDAIHFYQNNITKTELDDIATALSQIGMFSSEGSGWDILIQKEDEKYNIYFQVIDATLINDDFLQEISQLPKEIHSYSADKYVIVKFIKDGDTAHPIRTFE